MEGTEVRAEQIRTLYRQSVWVFAANPLNALILTLVLWRPEERAWRLGWLVAVCIVTGARLAIRRRFLAQMPSHEDASRWGTAFVAGAFAAGCLWGVAGAMFYDPQSPGAELLVTFLLGGMIAGASGTLASFLPAFVAYATPVLAVLSIRIAFDGLPVHIPIAVLVVIYGITMTMVSANSERSLVRSFRLRVENDHLLAQLTGAQSSLEEVNRTLEERVAERGAALERQSEALRDAQRMESVGLLAGGLAHDFNNLLTVVLANVALLRGSRLEDGDRASIDEIHSAAHRGATLVRQLLAFSRRQILKPQVLDLGAVVFDMKQFLGRLIGSHVELVIEIGSKPLAVKADPSQIQQVIINLATNARDAMPDGGRLTIRTEETRLADARSGAGVAPTAVPPGTYAVLVVLDTGAGMDDETRRLAFHPFFTTKEIGRGTGLGLATVHGIVEQSGGHVFVESQPGKGSTFSVYLPLVSPEEVSAAGEGARPSLPTSCPGNATVLLAEDDAMVRAATSRILSEAGHVVLAAESGAAALEIARRHDGKIDVLVTDLVMANIGGLELAKRLSAERGALRILFISGYSWDATLPSIDPEAGVDFLQKPFGPDALLESVARLLGRPTGRSTTAQT